jgi:acetyl esterase/lipase
MPTHIAIAPGADVDAEWIEPNPSLIIGQLATFASAARVEPHRIPGYWMHQKATERTIQPEEKVLLSLHGGGYIGGSAFSGDITAEIPRGILKHTPSIRHVFSPEYRLSSAEGNPFPAALIDVVAAYAHLLRAHKVSPKDVVIEGDSAGGNLALAFTRYLVDHREQLEPLGLGPPGALLLISPCSKPISSSSTVNAPSTASPKLSSSVLPASAPSIQTCTCPPHVYFMWRCGDTCTAHPAAEGPDGC